MAPLRREAEFESLSPQSFDTIFEVTGNFSTTENKRVCDIMASPSEKFQDWNSEVVHALTDYDAEFSQQMLPRADAEKQQPERTTKSSKSAKRAKLATISMQDYVRVFNHLTGGKGNVVQPNCDIKLFTKAQLTSVLRLNGLSLKNAWGVKNNLYLSLVGVELWNPFMLLDPLEPRNITDEEMMEDLHVLQW